MHARRLREEECGMIDTTIKVINVWADESGESHFRDIEFDLASVAVGGGLSDPIAVKNLWFRSTPVNQDFDFHPAPRRQLVVGIGGGVAELTVSDGETRLIEPGQVVLMEDTFGKGHKSKAHDGLARTALFIALAD
jgi:hypothetical protein